MTSSAWPALFGCASSICVTNGQNQAHGDRLVSETSACLKPAPLLFLSQLQRIDPDESGGAFVKHGLFDLDVAAFAAALMSLRDRAAQELRKISAVGMTIDLPLMPVR